MLMGILGRAPVVDKKVLFFSLFFRHEVCDNGNAMKQYNFQNNYGVIA